MVNLEEAGKITPLMAVITAQDSGTGHLHLQVRKPSAELARADKNGYIDVYKAASSAWPKSCGVCILHGKRRERRRRESRESAKSNGGPK
ncbi:hypothetical protein BM221_007957 [Beauveria bassiana]|uniref:Uncharacterized protein n=1 Tax=Beauveria bassiana TaxID=176275 RepID=A0A2N6NEN8_BEABA|nr:hypothetical protein BM221_007957 [Beauveria bassiana]